MADMLQRYLSSGLLDIGDDDTGLSKLRDAAADLQKLFNSQPRIALYHSLMVYSENVDSNIGTLIRTDARIPRGHCSAPGDSRRK